MRSIIGATTEKALITLIIFALGFVIDGKSSHISGGSIKYKSLGNNQYYIEAAVFRDCNGATYSSWTETVDYKCTSAVPATGWSTLNVTHLAFVAPTPAPFGGPYAGVTINSGQNQLVAEEVSDVCDKILNPNKTPNSRCRGGGAQGYLRFKFSGIVTLTACNWWRLGFSPVCCRNTGSSNTSSGGMYVHTFINTRDFPTNSAPDFADEVKPIPSACVGKKVYYGIGTIDYDGDSLRFELTCAMQDSTRCVTYRSGYSATAPASGLVMDSTTGLLSFTPATSGKRVVAFWVKEYERCTGKLKAKTLRDVQFRVETCTNNVPRDVSGISNIKAQNYTLLDSFKLEVCNGEYITFEDTIVDIDSASTTPDTLIFNSNYSKVLPGATMNVNYITKTKAVVQFNWRASIGINPVKVFYLVFNDDFCDYPGNGFSVFEINVRNSTNAGRDTAICLGDSAHLDASGGKLYQWKSVFGDSLIYSGPNRNVWSDTTKNDTNRTMRFVPSKTTMLEVWSDLQEGCIRAQACKTRDTVTITVAKPFNLTTTNDTTICFEDSTITIETKPDSVQFGYTYQWNKHKSIPADTIGNPDVTPLTSRTYYVTVTSDSGCIRFDTVDVDVTLPLPRILTATTPSDPTCVGVDAPITLNMGYQPTVCGSTTDQCYTPRLINSSDSTSRTNTAGGGTSGLVTDFPCPYGAAKTSARMQFMYTSAELQAMGINAGILDGIGFNVVNKRGASTFSGYTIKVGCTRAANFNSGQFLGGLTTVFTAKSVTIQNGWNLHAFDTNYALASGNNLVIEICYDNGSANTTTNAAVAYTPTTFQSCLTAHGSSSQCNSTFLSLASSFNRPHAQFSFCGQRDSSEFTYKWTPSLGLNFDTVQNPIANIDTTSTYTVQITDTFGLCSDTTSIKINIANIDAGPDTSMCANDTVQLFPDVVTSCGGRGVFVWTPSQYFEDDSVKNARVSVPQTTMVTVTFHDSCGCALKDSLMVYADSLKAPAPDMYDPDCASTNGRIKVNPVGGFGPYLYSIDGGSTFSPQDSFINLRIGFYDMQVIDSIGCISPITVDTLFNDSAPQITALIPKNISCAGFDDGEIEIKTRLGRYPLSYSVDTGNTWTVSTPTVRNLAPGKYIVYARGVQGCTSFPEEITLTEPDSLLLDFATYEDTCYQLGNGWATGKVSGGTQPYVYTWSGFSPSATNLPTRVGDTLFKDLFAFNGYNLNVIDGNGCIQDTTFEITERPELKFTRMEITPATCFGYADGKVLAEVSGGTKNYLFSIDSNATQLIPFPADTNYLHMDTTLNGISAIPKGTYNISVVDRYQCRIDSQIVVDHPTMMRLTTPRDSVRICVSTCAKLEVNSTGGNSPNHKYHWTPAISSLNVANVCPVEKENLYTAYASDEKGCISNTLILKVDLYDSLKLQVPNDTAICDGAFVQLDAFASGGDDNGYNFVWQPFANLSNAFVKDPIASPTEDMMYTLSLKDNCGSPEVIDSIKIEILPQPIVDFSADSLEGCPPFEVVFENKTNDSYRCVWSFGDGSKAATCEAVSKVYSRTGIYDVTLKVTSLDGCVDSLSKADYLNIYPVPMASFSMNPQPATLMDTRINFEDLSLGKVNKFEWNFASLDTSMQPSPRYKFPDEEKGVYPVKLLVTNIFGCQDDTIRNVVIDPEFFMYVPNTFTPNGDGKNDVWKPIGAGFELDYYEVSVFDRWGTMVFTTDNYDEGWDGIVAGTGEKAAVGVYTWRLVVGDDKSEKTLLERFGTLTILK